jgi:hypothetical protein
VYSSVDPKESYLYFTPHPQCLFASVFERPGNGSCADAARLFGGSLLRLAGFAHVHRWVCLSRIPARGYAVYWQVPLVARRLLGSEHSLDLMGCCPLL